MSCPSVSEAARIGSPCKWGRGLTAGWCALGQVHRKPHPLRKVLERLAADEAAQHHGLPAAAVEADLHKEASALVSTVVEVDATLVVPTLG